MTDKTSSLATNDFQLGTEISIDSLKNELTQLPKEYAPMMENIKQNLPAVQKTSENFYKSHSQYMNATIDITDLTPLHSVKHILARIERKKSALAEAQLKRRKSEIELRQKQNKLNEITDEFDRELMEIEIIEIMHGLSAGENYIKGALREMSFLMTQYNSVLEKLGKDHLTEEDFEEDEKKYHIMTALKQALCSARPRGGIIDEGNSIYLFDIGVNVAHAQAEVFNYLRQEQEMIEKGLAPSHEMTMEWMEKCAEKFKDCGEQFAVSRGLIVMDKKSLACPEPIALLKSSEEN
jgi:transposase